MTNKAIITRRGIPRSKITEATEIRDAEDLGLIVDRQLPQGTLVKGTVGQYAAIEAQGYRVKLLKDTNILEVGTYRIDIETSAPRIPEELEIPKDQEKTWTHHLVQLAALRNDEWINVIEEQDVEVVEPISTYGLFVVANPSQVDNLRNLPFIDWVGPFKPAYRISKNLQGLKGTIKYLNISVYPENEFGVVKEFLSRMESNILHEEIMNSTYGREYRVFLVEIDAKHIVVLSKLPMVRWLEYQPPMTTLGERETQIVAENLDAAAAPATAPVTGYQGWLAGVGLNGAGVTVAICDTGVDAMANNNAIGHVDLRGRQTAFENYTAGNIGGPVLTDTNGHGTNVAGIAVGNAATGQTEAPAPANFLWGQGVAPQANYVSQNFLLAQIQPTITTLIQDASNHGAQVMNNSWGADNTGGSGYGAGSRIIDLAVRDPNSAVAGLEYLVIVCAAGNEGGNVNTISAPHESKNDISVGNSLTSRPGGFPSDDIRGIAGTSSRGPAVDGRILPTVVAPGTNVSSALSRTSPIQPIAGTGVPDPLNPGNMIDQYVFMTGTSQASPHVAGTCALLIEWWRDLRGGRNPSPALLKAMLINGAVDLVGGENWRCLNRTSADKGTWSLQSGSIHRRNMNFTSTALATNNTQLNQVASLANLTTAGQWFFDAGTNRIYVWMQGNIDPGDPNVEFLHAQDSQPVPSIPNEHQGWGRVSIQNIISQAPTSDRGPKIFSDQRHAFTANGQVHTIRVAPFDITLPMRITLVWTDAAGTVGTVPSLVNDLDLEVTEVATGNIFRGNVFANGFSTPGGAFDTINNVECVYIQNPAGIYEVSVIASNIAASARSDITTPWQDFAIVIDNAEAPATTPVSVVPVIDRSGSMVGSGYVGIAKTSSKQFVGLMSIDDKLSVVSFGSTADVEYPTGAAPTLQTITGQLTRDDANNEIEGIGFGGCTYMGDGINEAKNLLNVAVGYRAMILLSDGYDNKGCDPTNPAKPSALDAVAGLPDNMPIYTCAMGPTSDQILLEQIATSTDGLYYYMPTIDDLFEIYNYIRGNITGNAIVVNESAVASNSRIGAFVDAAATEATFTVAWADANLRMVAREPQEKNEISIRLRNPYNRLLHPDDSSVRQIKGQGYVIFKVDEPIPGQWYVEVNTYDDTHVRYTVGGFVNSPIQIDVSLQPAQIVAGVPLNIAVQVHDDTVQLFGYKVDTLVTSPKLSVSALLNKYKTQLQQIRPSDMLDGDTMPQDIAKLTALRTELLKEEKIDLFSHNVSSVTLRSKTIRDLLESRFAYLLKPSVYSPRLDSLPSTIVPSEDVRGLTRLTPVQPRLSTIKSGIHVGKFKETTQQGSYNVAVTVKGVSSISKTKFVRKKLISILAR